MHQDSNAYLQITDKLLVLLLQVYRSFRKQPSFQQLASLGLSYNEEHHVDKKTTLLSHWLTTPASGLQGIPTMGPVLFLRLSTP